MTTKLQKLPQLSLHTLLFALSFWGSATRLLLISFFALAVLLLRTLEIQASTDATLFQTLTIEGQLFVYAICTFLVLDVGYVIISRAYAFSRMNDVVTLLTAEAVLATSYFLPYIVVVSDQFARISRFIFVAGLLILSARLVLGMLYGKSIKK